MKPTIRLVGLLVNPAIFAVWTLFLGGLVVTGGYRVYLRPEFGAPLAIAQFVAMGFMIASFVRRQGEGAESVSLLRALVLLSPILYAMVISDPTLGGAAFKTRYTGTDGIEAGRMGRIRPSLGADPESTRPNGVSGVAKGDSTPKPTILELLVTPALYVGREVSIEGMLLRDEQIRNRFGGRNTVVYRFLITCCAADALPLAIAVDPEEPESLESGQWVEVDGLFEMTRFNGRAAPLISKAKIRTVKPPSSPYLY